MQQYGSKYLFYLQPPPPPTMVVGAQNSTFSEHGHVLYQIKGNEASVEHHASTYSLLTHTLNLWVGLKGKKKNLNVVMLHIKLRGKKYRLT